MIKIKCSLINSYIDSFFREYLYVYPHSFLLATQVLMSKDTHIFLCFEESENIVKTSVYQILLTVIQSSKSIIYIQLFHLLLAMFSPKSAEKQQLDRISLSSLEHSPKSNINGQYFFTEKSRLVQQRQHFLPCLLVLPKHL